jgi:Acyl-CoA dehydrogenase, C-terminal domain
MEAAERELLQATIDEALAAVDADRVDSLDAVLAKLGWLEMLDAERVDAVSVVFRSLGTANGMGSVLDDVIVTALGIEPRGDLAVVLPPFARWNAPGTLNGGVSARGLATSRVISAGELLVVGGSGTNPRAVTVPTYEADVHAVRGVDPGAGLHTVQLVHSLSDAEPLERDGWEAAVAWGRTAIAHQLAGACRSMVDLARTHALQRVQFGRPIARFQAVRHRLAEALIAVEALDSSLTAAMDDPGPLTAALAKAVAGRTARTVGAHSQQILAGIGFTTDHPFHRFLKRSMTLDGLLGSADAITLDLGRHLVSARRVPTLIEL